MVTNVLEYLEASERRFPGRCAYKDTKDSYTFSQTGTMARAIGTSLARLEKQGRPVAVLMEKSASMIVALLGAVYGGMCYCPIDVKMPEERIRSIFSVLEPAAVIAEAEYFALAKELVGPGDSGLSCQVFLFEELVKGAVDEAALSKIRESARETDPLYILFTSGSTGVPKGVVMNHRVIINNMEWLAEEFGFTEEDVMGNQVPLHFDVANHDIYCPLKFGCTTVLIPPDYFTFPAKLVSFLNENRVTGIFWVPFALCVAADLGILEAEVPEYLKYVFFAGEVMPVKQLNYWRRFLPDAVYVNMYGSTETHVCTSYRLDREFSDDERLPIGRPCRNVKVLVMGEDGRVIAPGGETAESGGPGRAGETEIGELCICDGAFALGYYRNDGLTAERFTENPVSGGKMYRTGDLVSFNGRGELLYHGRRDYQVKRLGYRIEPGEIEAAAGKILEVERCACFYDEMKKTIVLLYSGKKVERKNMVAALAKRLPKYMMPGKFVFLEKMPVNGNGKIDRRRLKELYV